MAFIDKITSAFKGKPEPADSRLEEYEQIFEQARKKFMTPEKKAELESLYAQLLTKSDDVASGQLQFLGLDTIKEKMGDRWPRLQSLVHKTAEEVINANVTMHDIHFLYKEDRFVIIFTKSTIDEINQKVGLISAEIMRRLLELDGEQFKEIQIKQDVKKLEVGTFLDEEFPDMLDYIYQQYNPGPEKAESVAATGPDGKPLLTYSYLPMWENSKSAITTYMCFAQKPNGPANIVDAYKSLYSGKSLGEKTALDMTILKKAIADFQTMESNGYKLYIICPVQHETLYNFTSYEEYKTLCQNIPASMRQFLIFMVTNSENYSLPVRDTYWFVPLLRNYCVQIFVDIPMQTDKNVQFLRNGKVDGVGFRFENDPELDVRSVLADFNSNIRPLKMDRIFAYEVTTEESAKTLIKMGFEYLGGEAINASVPLPEGTYYNEREQYLSDLLSN